MVPSDRDVGFGVLLAAATVLSDCDVGFGVLLADTPGRLEVGELGVCLIGGLGGLDMRPGLEGLKWMRQTVSRRTR